MSKTCLKRLQGATKHEVNYKSGGRNKKHANFFYIKWGPKYDLCAVLGPAVLLKYVLYRKRNIQRTKRGLS